MKLYRAIERKRSAKKREGSQKKRTWERKEAHLRVVDHEGTQLDKKERKDAQKSVKIRSTKKHK